MFNVAVISLKSIVKFIIKIIITLVISVMIFNLFSQKVSAWNNTFDITYVNIISNNLAISTIHE